MKLNLKNQIEKYMIEMIISIPLFVVSLYYGITIKQLKISKLGFLFSFMYYSLVVWGMLDFLNEIMNVLNLL